MQTWVQKPRAFALLVFRTAIVMWGLSILEAAQGASDVTGVSAYTVQKWASSYYLALIGTPPDDIDDDDPQRDILSPSSCILQTHPYFFFGAYLCAVMALAAALEGISRVFGQHRDNGVADIGFQAALDVGVGELDYVPHPSPGPQDPHPHRTWRQRGRRRLCHAHRRQPPLWSQAGFS